MMHGLKEKILQGSIWSFAGSSGNQIFGFIVFIILSHELSPADFGVMALAMVFAEIMNPLVRLGLSAGLVRQQEIRESSANTVFWLTLVNGIFYMILLTLIAPWAARSMEMEELAHVLRLLSPLPVLFALSTVQEAMLEHAYRFKSLAKRTLVASGISGSIAIAMAVGGMGLYSLVFQKLASAALLTLILWFETGWRPRRMFSMAEAKELLHHGVPLMFSSFLVTGTNRLKDFLVGLFLGVNALGFLRIASKLNDFVVQFTISLLTSVALTTFSKLQGDKVALNRMYRRLTQACGMLAFPAFFGMAVIAPKFVPFVFGEQWQQSATLMQLLCLASFSSTLNYFYKPLMTAIGKSGAALKANMLEFILTAVIITAMAQFSLSMVMVGYVLCYSIVTVVTLARVRREVDLNIRKFLSGFIPPIVSSLVMAVAVFALQRMLDTHVAPALSFAVLIPAGVLVYGGCMRLCFPAYTDTIRQTALPLITGMLKKKRG